MSQFLRRWSISSVCTCMHIFVVTSLVWASRSLDNHDAKRQLPSAGEFMRMILLCCSLVDSKTATISSEHNGFLDLQDLHHSFLSGGLKPLQDGQIQLVTGQSGVLRWDKESASLDRSTSNNQVCVDACVSMMIEKIASVKTGSDFVGRILKKKVTTDQRNEWYQG